MHCESRSFSTVTKTFTDSEGNVKTQSKSAKSGKSAHYAGEYSESDDEPEVTGGLGLNPNNWMRFRDKLVYPENLELKPISVSEFNEVSESGNAKIDLDLPTQLNIQQPDLLMLNNKINPMMMINQQSLPTHNFADITKLNNINDLMMMNKQFPNINSNNKSSLSQQTSSSFQTSSSKTMSSSTSSSSTTSTSSTMTSSSSKSIMQQSSSMSSSSISSSGLSNQLLDNNLASLKAEIMGPNLVDMIKMNSSGNGSDASSTRSTSSCTSSGTTQQLPLIETSLPGFVNFNDLLATNPLGQSQMTSKVSSSSMRSSTSSSVSSTSTTVGQPTTISFDPTKMSIEDVLNRNLATLNINLDANPLMNKQEVAQQSQQQSMSSFMSKSESNKIEEVKQQATSSFEQQSIVKSSASSSSSTKVVQQSSSSSTNSSSKKGIFEFEKSAV